MDPKQIVHSDPDVLGGTPVFVGTRVRGVSREQEFAFLEEASRALVVKVT